MTILFYAADPGTLPVAEAVAPAGVDLRLWRPHSDGLPRHLPRCATNLCWWALDRSGGFASHDFVEISLWRRKRMLHRLLMTPRWYRFPFMALDDLQIGDLWTDPAERGRGLARVAIAQAHRLARSRTARLWYLVDAGNRQSIALIEACGYRCVAAGRRTRPLGLTPIGRFRPDPTAPATG